jgi:hypothetical protein
MTILRAHYIVYVVRGNDQNSPTELEWSFILIPELLTRLSLYSSTLFQ